MTNTETKLNPTLQTLKSHVSIRSFSNDTISDEILSNIIEVSRRAPTSSNMQAYSIIVIKDSAVKKELAELAGGQTYVETCPVLLAFCADLHRLEISCELHDIEMKNSLESFVIASVDAALVGMSCEVAAESSGLGTVMIGGLRNHPKAVAKLLGLPPKVFVTFGMCLGWPIVDRIPPQKPRLPKGLVVHHEQYRTDSMNEDIVKYDKNLAAHYDTLNKKTNTAAWSGVMARSLNKPLRPHLKDELVQLGFKLE